MARVVSRPRPFFLMAGKNYRIKGQKISPHGFALMVYEFSDLCKANSIPSKDLNQWLKMCPEVLYTSIPLPSSWTFDYGKRVQLSRQYRGAHHPILSSEIETSSEGWIQAVRPTGCEVSFINKMEAKSRDKVVTITENIVKFIPYRYLLKVMTPDDRIEIPQGSSPPLDGLMVGDSGGVQVKLDIVHDSRM